MSIITIVLFIASLAFYAATLFLLRNPIITTVCMLFATACVVGGVITYSYGFWPVILVASLLAVAVIIGSFYNANKRKHTVVMEEEVIEPISE